MDENRITEDRLPRLERRQNWQLLAVAVPVILGGFGLAVGYGRLTAKVEGGQLQIRELVEADQRMWERLNSLTPILTKMSADLAYFRGRVEDFDDDNGYQQGYTP